MKLNMKTTVIGATRDTMKRVNVTAEMGGIETGIGYEIHGYQRPGSQFYKVWEHTASVFSTSYNGASHMCTIDGLMWDTEDPLQDIAKCLNPWFSDDADHLEIWYKNRFIGCVYPTGTGIVNPGTRGEKPYRIFAPADILSALNIIRADRNKKEALANYLVWHDNGKRGQFGYTEETGNIAEIVKSYKAHGVHIHSIDKI